MIEGEWSIVAVDYGGEALPGRLGHLQIIGSRFALQIGGAPREVGAVEFDASATPATLDLVWREPGGLESRRLRAIVRVRGDLLQLCYYPEAAGRRPGAFASDGHTPAILVRCRRR